MIEISKEQAKYLHEHGIVRGVTRTMSQKSHRHRYYAATEEKIVKCLEKYNQEQTVVMTYGKVD